MPDGSSGDLWLYWLLVLIFFVFLCMPDSPTYHAHFVCKYLWDVNGIPSHVTSSGSLCAQWRVWSKNLPGGVSLTTSNRCRKICWQQAAWLSEGGDQHYRMRTTSGIFERRWPTLHQESRQPRMFKIQRTKTASKEKWPTLRQGRLVISFNEIQVVVPLQLGNLPSTRQYVFIHVCIV